MSRRRRTRREETKAALHYTRSQGQRSTQIQHSYWCKSWNQPQGLYTRSQDWNRKKLFNLPQVLINAELYGLVLAARLKKDTIKFGRPMFQHLLISWRQCSSILWVTWGQFATPMLKVGPKIFGPCLTPSVKRGWIRHTATHQTSPSSRSRIPYVPVSRLLVCRYIMPLPGTSARIYRLDGPPPAPPARILNLFFNPSPPHA